MPVLIWDCVRCFFRRCIRSSISSSLIMGILLSISTVLVKEARSIPLFEFVAVTSTASWCLCIVLGSLNNVFFQGSSGAIFGNLRDFPRLFLIGLFYTLSTFLFYMAVQSLLISEAVVLYYLFPLFCSILGALFLRSLCGYQSVAGAVICCAGGIVVAIPWWEIINGINSWDELAKIYRNGTGYGALSAVCASILYLLSGWRWDSRVPSEFSSTIPLSVWSFQIQACASFILVFSGRFGSFVPFQNIENVHWLLLAGFTVSTTASRLVSSWVIKNKTKSFVVVMEALHMIWGTLGAFIVCQEMPSICALVGGGLMMVGISVLSLQAQHRDDDMEDWYVGDPPACEDVFQTTATMFTMSTDIWTPWIRVKWVWKLVDILPMRHVGMSHG